MGKQLRMEETELQRRLVKDTKYTKLIKEIRIKEE